ncbi:glycoside hydrolase family 3 N-terminal domain-containing protein [Alistipes putredinis]|uniref:glycoside hydrolase family 3 N-terminal domain-containing protein n=1 Tax=Alistipes putredinis TaxID=28117 RepID=UPI003992D065
MDVIHGYETTFPIPLGLTATWDMEAVERAARISAVEASAAGICWTLLPAMVDIARSPLGTCVRRASARILPRQRCWRGRSSTAIRGVIRCICHRRDHRDAEALMLSLRCLPEKRGRDYGTTDDEPPAHGRNEYFSAPTRRPSIEAGAGAASLGSPFSTRSTWFPPRPTAGR